MLSESPPPTPVGAPETIAVGTIRPFDYAPRTRIVFGSGTLSQLGELVTQLGGSRVLLVSDAGVVSAGHPARAAETMTKAGCDVVLFDDVHPNPTEANVDRCAAAAREAEVDLIVAVGGGSSLDCAKGANFVLSGGGRMRDYHGVGKARGPMLPMIAVPTTAGTGSEAQSFALISHDETHVKMACGDPRAACAVALLDPDLIASTPRNVAVATALDAVSHALETAVTTKRNAISRLFSAQAWKLLASSARAMIFGHADGETRSAVLLGAHLAGAAIENSMLGAAHALANPLTAKYGTTHGYAVARMLPHVIRYNAEVAQETYERLADDANLSGNGSGADRLADFVAGLLTAAELPVRLSDAGVSESDLPALAEAASQQWTGTFNPRPVTSDSLLEIYRCAY